MTTDYFELLNQPRQPWLDLDALKARFHSLSTEVHPDRVHTATELEKQAAQQRYTELNAAYQCLHDPRLRLRHLLELELGRKPSDLTNVPDDLMELFFGVGKIFREIDALLTEKAKITAPLLQVEWFARGQEYVERLGEWREKISARRAALLTRLQELNNSWQPGAAKPTEPLLSIWRLLSFYDRWLAQIQDRVVQLSF